MTAAPGMQIRCGGCGRTLTLADIGGMPPTCPHCDGRPVPERIGEFVLDRPIAAGGMAEVYLAHHQDLGTRVAIKIMPPPSGEDATAMRERFAREARLQAAIDHPGVVRVLDCDVLEDRPYLVLEYVPGQSLRALLAEGPLPVGEAVRLAVGIADVLAAAHAHGVLHRDIKPENVLRAEDGRVRVLDFGIARARDGGAEAPVTRTGEILGTPQYMAPEQILDAGDEIDERADVHALGVVLYELLTGKNPFAGANLFAELKLVESLVPRPVSEVRSDVPKSLDRVIATALQKDRGSRQPSAAAFGEQLRAAIEPAAPKAARWPLVFAGLGLAVAAVAIVMATSTAREGEAPTRVDPVVAAPPTAFERGMARWHRGEFFAAIADFEAAGTSDAMAHARLAWLVAYRALPRVIGVPAAWSDCDERRRLRLFGRADPGADRASAGPDVGALLSVGDAVTAQGVLDGFKSAHVAPTPVQTALLPTRDLLAAHLACWDATVLRRVTARADYADAAPEVVSVLRLRFASRAERRLLLRDRARRMPSSGPDHWLLRMLAADAVDPNGLSSDAEMAWLHGAGEAAVVWLAGLRRWQSGRSGVAIDSAERARLLRLLAGCDPVEVPVAGELQHRLNDEPVYRPAALTAPPGYWESPAELRAALEAASVDLRSFEAMAALLRAGIEPDFGVDPWRLLHVPEFRLDWEQEVCGGVE